MNDVHDVQRVGYYQGSRWLVVELRLNPRWLARNAPATVGGVLDHRNFFRPALHLARDHEALRAQASENMRTAPNIIITGTPGVGKTTHCELLAKSTGLNHLSINQVVKEKECQDGYDEELKTSIVDEDKLLDSIEDEVKKGGNIIDWHACDLFPESWIDLVVVLRARTETLYDRLQARKYTQKKLDENMDAEIMEVVLQEARESYDERIVVELKSNTAEDVDSNVERIEQWVENWKKNNSDQSDAEQANGGNSEINGGT